MFPDEPAAARVWQEPQPFASHTALPAVASPPPPPVEPPPVLPLGVDVLGGVDADGEYVERGNAPNPTLDAPLVSVPEIAITTTITTMPTMVPRRAATSTLIIARATLPAWPQCVVWYSQYPKQGMCGAPSNDDV